MNWVPLSLTHLRGFLAPVVVCLALYAPIPWAFALCLVAAFLSDIFDGIIARRLGIATPLLRRLDSVVDTLFYLACIFAAWHLYPAALVQRRAALAVLIALEGIRYGFDYAKFRREAAYHMWSSKLWGIGLFTAFLALLGFGSTWALYPAIYLGIAADIEGLVISVIMPRWQSDVPSFVHALRLRSAAAVPPPAS